MHFNITESFNVSECGVILPVILPVHISTDMVSKLDKNNQGAQYNIYPIYTPTLTLLLKKKRGKKNPAHYFLHETEDTRNLIVMLL